MCKPIALLAKIESHPVNNFRQKHFFPKECFRLRQHSRGDYDLEKIPTVNYARPIELRRRMGVGMADWNTGCVNDATNSQSYVTLVRASVASFAFYLGQ